MPSGNVGQLSLEPARLYSRNKNLLRALEKQCSIIILFVACNVLFTKSGQLARHLSLNTA